MTVKTERGSLLQKNTDTGATEFFLKQATMNLSDRLAFSSGAIEDLYSRHYRRLLDSPCDREMTVRHPVTNEALPVKMFGANNYLSLSNHPSVRAAMARAVDAYGLSMTGSPLLNGQSALHARLEERLAEFRGYEACMLFPSGYMANLAWVTSLVRDQDIVLYDEFSHTSFLEGLASRKKTERYRFLHNDAEDLRELLEQYRPNTERDVYIFVEGLYSADGDPAPLNLIAPMAREYGAVLVVDDAHGTGSMGPTGRGTLEYHDVIGMADITMGTLSKGLGATGGFICGNRDLITYLRAFSKPYIFSASLSPVVVAGVIAAIDVIDAEPERVARLRDLCAYALKKLEPFGLKMDPPTPILPLRTPRGMDVGEAALRLLEAGYFANPFAHPAVPIGKERLRISLMADHTKEDIDGLAAALEKIWSDFEAEKKAAG